MMTNPRNFNDLRIGAARMFAQTMIFVDDQASQDMPEEAPPVNLHHPAKGITRKMPDNELKEQGGTGNSGSGYAFNAQSLIYNAMNQGLICSVLRPKEGECFQAQVVEAAQVADIVCLDWEIYNDGGDAASKIIRDILKKDTDQNGRLRLIAIYTGDITNNDIIVDKVFQQVPKEIREEQKFTKTTSGINSKSGARIVCLFKKQGIQLDPNISNNQVSEGDLPQRLQQEFAKLSEGLLSNAALATIASIRSSTHHVLSKFAGQMDGPFFHHRAMIDNPEDAEEYAVNIVLSELKGTIDKQQIGKTQTGPPAIDARVQALAKDSGKPGMLTLRYVSKEISKTYELQVNHAIKMVSDGLSRTLEDLSNKELPNRPKNNDFNKSFSSLFSNNLETTRFNMDQFAALTGVQSYPGSILCLSDEWLPKLGLGTIIQDNDTYLMCLQASCDSVRISEETNFLFVRLDKKNNRNSKEPDHIVPISSESNKEFKYIGLSAASESYLATRIIKFPGSPETKTVNAERNGQSPGFCFKDTEGKKYIWVADLKRRRALRTVQRLAQDMGRLGFDEFEPYRTS